MRKISPRYRLISEDAILVDVIHTDAANTIAGGFGILEAVGKYDFYPSGGVQAEGCQFDPGRVVEFFKSLQNVNPVVAVQTIVSTLAEKVSCNHHRAVQLLIDVTSATMDPYQILQPVAYRCLDYTTFLQGRCASCKKDGCRKMGLWFEHWVSNIARPRQPTDLEFYIAANDTAPFNSKSQIQLVSLIK